MAFLRVSSAFSAPLRRSHGLASWFAAARPFRPCYSFHVTGFEGVHAAAVTPRGPKGDIDFGAAFELIDYFSKAGVDGIVLFASEGEYPAFTAQERCRLVYLAAKRSRVPVLAGVGSATLDASVELAREAIGAGAAALLVPPPLFFRYDQDDMRAFYEQFAAQAGRDARSLLYHSPETGTIAPETAAALLAGGRFAGMVDAVAEAGAFPATCWLAMGRCSAKRPPAWFPAPPARLRVCSSRSTARSRPVRPAPPNHCAAVCVRCWSGPPFFLAPRCGKPAWPCTASRPVLPPRPFPPANSASWTNSANGSATWMAEFGKLSANA